MKYESAERDRQVLLSEMKRLREQYEDLIKQMEQTQAIIDKQQVLLYNPELQIRRGKRDGLGVIFHISP